MRPVPKKRISVVKIHCGWEDFGRSKFDDAISVARGTIRNSGKDHATKGYAQLLIARVQRRKNNLLEAEKLTKESIQEFKLREYRHRALGRAYANLAHTNILLAMKSEEGERADRLKFALTQLEEADRIYSFRHYDSGTRPEVQNLRCLVKFCEGEYNFAIERAERVYKEASARKDYVEMSTARIIQCMSFLKLARKPDTRCHESAKYFIEAHKRAKDAVRVADAKGDEGHPRRRARARIWLGKTYLTIPVFNMTEAQNNFRAATDLLPKPKAASGYIGEELDDLEQEMLAIDKADKKGVLILSEDMIYSTTSAFVATHKWADIKEEFEEKVVAAWFNSGLRATQILARTKIRKSLLDTVRARCLKKELIAKKRLNSRRGPGHRITSQKVRAEEMAPAKFTPSSDLSTDQIPQPSPN